MSNINPKIFKAYDVRGVYPDEINEDVAYKIGQAFVKFLEGHGQADNRQIIVGYDARESSPYLFEALIQGLLGQGVDVIDIGAVSTMLFYWSIIKEQAAGGIMITASHNPSQYNGFKICTKYSRSICEINGLFEIRDLAINGNMGISANPGKIIKKNFLAEYVDSVAKKFAIEKFKSIKMVIDCGNGIAGPELEELLKKMPDQVDLLYAEPDGRFPNHEANPSKEETLTVLKSRVLSGKANLGVALDGDGDRIAFIDETGKSVRGDFISALIARDLLKQNPGQKIFYEVRSSKIVPETVEATGGFPILGRPGHALIKEQMRQENILFGGELSGHYFYRNSGYVEDTLFTLLKILQILNSEQKPFSKIIAPFKKYFASGEINFEVNNPDEILSLAEQKHSGAQIKKIDGLTVIYPDWWFNLRKSNTEPLIRLNLEADSAELLEEKKKEISSLVV